jgi:hypothetical protein
MLADLIGLMILFILKKTSSCQTLNVDHAQLRKIINTGTKTRNRKSNLRNKDQYHLWMLYFNNLIYSKSLGLYDA